MKNSIRYWIIALTLPALLLSSDFAYADAGDFELSVRNQVQTAANRFEFDVYLLDTDPLNDFYLSTEQFGILFNSTIYQGGTVSVAIDNTGSGLGVNQIIYQTPGLETDAGYPNQTLIKLAGEISRIPLAQCTLISKVSPGTLVTHFILTSTVSFAAGTTPDLAFTSSTDVTPLYATRIVTSDGSNVSELPVTSGSNALIYGNPSLNAQPAAFNVTGGGAYCEGGAGLPVGLSDSETGVTYTLVRGTTDLTPTVAGTGAAISFGNQTVDGVYTVRGTNAGGTTTMTGSATITVNPLPLAAGTITGTAAVCQGQSGVAYNVGAITNATSYTWSYTGSGASIIGSTNSITINFASNATSGNLTVYGVNACGNGTVSTNYPITVNPLPAAAGTITGTASVCQGAASVVYSVGTITNATSYLWAYSGTGAFITGTSNSVTVSFAASATSGNLTVRGVNTCGNGTISAGYPVTVNALPATSDITGNATPACSSTGNVYSVSSTSGSSYAWTVPTGSNITAGSGTNSITVSFGTNNGNIAVTETNSTGCVGSTKTLAISLTGCGLDANFDGVPLSVCVGSAVTFTNTSIGTSGSTTYSWNFGSGATPSTANTIGPHSVTYSTSGLKTVSLTITEGATNTENKVDYITVNPLPAAAGTITGTAALCQGQSAVSYSVPAIANATSYFWAYSGTGATITGTTSSVTVSFAANATSGNLTVRGINSCGNGTVSANYPITVNPLPSAAGTITGTPAVCQGHTAVAYSVPAITNSASYNWSYSGTGATITGTTNSVTISFAANATSGNLSVYGVNTCGNGTVSANYPITVNPLPAAAGTIAGTAAVCQGQSAVSYSVPVITNATSYLWAYSGTGATITGTTNSVTVSFTASATSGNLTVRGVNTCGNGTISAGYPVTVNALPATSDITGNATPACSSTGNVYSVTSTPGSIYAWTVPTGSIITAGSGTNSITVSFGTNNGNITVIETNSTGCVGSMKTLAISLAGCGLDANFTATPLEACMGATIAFSNTSLGTTGSTTYSWNFGSDAAPATANTIGPHGVTYSTSGLKTVTLIITDGASNTETKTDYITIDPLPSAAGTITGTAIVCQGQGGIAYNVPAITNATSYLWAYSGTGATITGTTNSVTVSFAANATSGNLTVRGVNSCGNGVVSPAYAIAMNLLPAAAGTITGTASVCQGTSSVIYTVPVIGNATSYLWAYSGTGATITGTTNSATVSFASNATSGNLTVRGVNSCGNGTASANYLITVNALPAQPTVTAGSATTFCAGGSVSLTSSVGTTYLWSTGAVTQSIDVNTSGSYTVQVTNAASCQSIASAPTVVTVNTLPVVNAGTDKSIPNGTSTTLDATVTGTGPFTYSWAPSNMLVNATVVDPTTVNLPTTTTFTLTATSTATTCSNSDAVTVTVTGGPLSSNPTATPSTVCAGLSVQLAAVASGGSGTYTYSWTSVPAGFTSNIANPAVTPAVNTVYHVAVNDGYNTVNTQVSVTVNALPAQPVITPGGPTSFCAGSGVALTSSTGTTYLWSNGATSASINVVASGTFTVRVTNAAGCQSIPSEAVTTTVNALPSAPIVGEITPPTCSLATGSVVMMGLPSTGNWTLTRYPGTYTLDGSGANYTVDGLSSGLYNYTVTNASGCTSTLSANVNIPAQPATPATPLVGTITQPTYTVPTGSVNLSGLPVSGSWTITINPGGATITASGASRTVTGLDPGTYTFTVTNAAGCTSLPTAEVTINARPGVPNLVINNPATICSNQTTDLTLPAVTAGSDENLTYTYWTDAAATVAYATPTTATEGTYYIRGTSTAGYYNTKPVVVTADQLPVAYAGPDQVLEYIFGTDLNADIPEVGVGVWSLVTGQGEIFNSAAPITAVNGLGLGDNVFQWSVTNGACPEVTDRVTIKVNDLLIPTLITPNGDGRNDYFVLRGLETLGKTQLVIFDRRGLKVYENKEYDNTWEGLDYNSNPLPDDTYFYVLKSANGKSLSGYIVVRR